MSQINKLGYVLKDLPEGIEKADDKSLWFVASAECVDEDGDIVRIDGMDLSMHRPDSPIKILTQHLRRLPDGTPPIVGRIEEFKRATLNKAGKSQKALLGRMSWAPTELAQKHKELFDAGYMESFSIGASVTDAKPLKGGGNDYQKTILREISVVTIPANADAVVLRALEEKFGDQLDKPKDAVLELLEQSVSLLEELRQFNLSLTRRLDDLESAFVAKSAGGSPTGDPQEPAHDEARETLKSHLRSILEQL